MYKYLILFFITGLILSCDSVTKTTKATSQELLYFKDYNTNLCFCQVNSQSYAAYYVKSITNVPCDSLVLNQIKNQ